MTAYINAISYYLPSVEISNEYLAQCFPEWSIEKITSKTGINKRFIARSDEFVSDMAVTVAKKMFLEYSVNPNDIDFILLCTQSPDYFLPTTACIVQDLLKIPTSCGALDFNLGCSGYVYGLSLAKGLIAANIAKNILLITSETYSKFIHEKDKSNRTIFGDAASATLISDRPGLAMIGNFELGTDGAGAKNLIVKEGGLRHPIEKVTSSMDYLDEFGNVRNDKNLFMNGAEIFNFTIESVPKLVENTFKKNNIESHLQIQHFVFHQANKYILNHLRKKIGITEDKFHYHITNCGNTVSSTIPIVLKEKFQDNTIKENEIILLAGFGVGYSWGGTILYT